MLDVRLNAGDKRRTGEIASLPRASASEPAKGIYGHIWQSNPSQRVRHD